MHLDGRSSSSQLKSISGSNCLLLLAKKSHPTKVPLRPSQIQPRSSSPPRRKSSAKGAGARESILSLSSIMYRLRWVDCFLSRCRPLSTQTVARPEFVHGTNHLVISAGCMNSRWNRVYPKWWHFEDERPEPKKLEDSFPVPKVSLATIALDPNDLSHGQWTYVSIAAFVFLLGAVFFFSPIPEVTDADMGRQAEQCSDLTGYEEKPLSKQYKLFFGAAAQFIKYSQESAGLTASQASDSYAIGQSLFAIGRFGCRPIHVCEAAYCAGSRIQVTHDLS